MSLYLLALSLLLPAQNNPDQAARFEEWRKATQEWSKANPPRESTGLVPIADLGKGAYKGEQGGLYPGGANEAPRAHLEAGLRLARQVTPLDQEGRPSASGKIVLLSIGMSNTTQEFREFLKLAASDGELNPKLAVVDGAQGSQTASRIADPNAPYWKNVDARLSQAGVTARQVQVAWLKEANPRPVEPFPSEMKKLAADLTRILRNLREKFPNLKIAYLSSRTYGGYAGGPLNPEPHAYESGFAVKWVISGQIAGDPDLVFDPAKGPVRAPWIAWGPYLWADGIKGRSGGFAWRREDFGLDGTHPSPAGQRKVAELLLGFLKSDATSRPWFVSPRAGAMTQNGFEDRAYE